MAPELTAFVDRLAVERGGMAAIRGWLEVVDGGKGATSPSPAPAAPAAPLVLVPPPAEPAGQLDLVSWAPRPAKPLPPPGSQLDLF